MVEVMEDDNIKPEEPNIILFIDGGCSGNGQKDLSNRKMVSVVTDGDGQLISEVENSGGSNNIAELIALKEALLFCSEYDYNKPIIYTDSTNTIAWSKNFCRSKKVNDYDTTISIQEEIFNIAEYLDYELIWIPREENLAGHYIEDKYGV